MSFILDPTRVYEIKGEVCKLRGVFLQPTVANNQSVIAGVSDKIIRVMGMLANSTAGTVANLNFKSASGGTNIMNIAIPANTSATPNVILPITDSGYGECNTGEGLFVDCATTITNLTVFYLVYTA